VNAAEFSILRAVIANLRRASAHIKRGDLYAATLLFSQARHEAGFGIGQISMLPGVRAPSWERVRRCIGTVEHQLLRAIRTATFPPRRADVREVAAAIAEGVKILRTRDGADISDEQANERGNNLAQGLCEIFGVFERPSQEWTQIHGLQPQAECGVRLRVSGPSYR
jgi:hypothetical protein